MAYRPPLPDETNLPATINGWIHEPEAGRNAHYWLSQDESTSLGVYYSTGTVRVKVADERFQGFENTEVIIDRHIEERCRHTDQEKEIVATVVDEAIDWMERTDPATWTLPVANEAIFDTPEGYSLAVCYLESQDVTIYYERDGVEGSPDRRNPNLPEEHQFLVVRVLRGSGNATVSVAPWLRAHDHEMEEVVDPPAECGLDVAIKLAKDFAAPDVAATTVGQAGLREWSNA